MSYAMRLSVTAAVDGAGDGTFYVPVTYGAIMMIQYVKTDYADGVDFTITVDSTGEALWAELNVNAAKIVYPRADVQDLVGADALYAATFNRVEPVYMVNDRVKIVVANGGVSKTGSFTVVVK